MLSTRPHKKKGDCPAALPHAARQSPIVVTWNQLNWFESYALTPTPASTGAMFVTVPSIVCGLSSRLRIGQARSTAACSSAIVSSDAEDEA